MEWNNRHAVAERGTATRAPTPLNTKLNNQSCGKLAQCSDDDADAGNERRLHPPVRVRSTVLSFGRSVSLVIITDGWETAK